MDYDRILSRIGELSRWNLINLALLWLPPMMGGIIVLQTSFSVLPPSKFRCRMPCEDESATYGDPRFNESMIHPEVIEDFFISVVRCKLWDNSGWIKPPVDLVPTAPAAAGPLL